MVDPFLHPFAKPTRESFTRIVRGDGALVWDADGNELVDGMASLWYCAIGHGRGEMADAIAAQVRQIEAYSCFDPFTNEPAEQLAAELHEIAPMPDARVFFCCSGSEAIDSAMKIARIAHVQAGQPQRKLIISRGRGYHGVAYGGTSAQGIAPNREHFGPFVDDVVQVDADDVESLATLMRERSDEIAAVLTEPVQGAGGIHPPADGYLESVRRLCDQHGAFLVFDEVITGYGRLGSWFAAHHYGVRPDLVTFAKAVTSGYQPLGGVFVGPAVRAGLEADPEFFLRHGFTYSGHPTACAAGITNLAIMRREGLVERATQVGGRLRDGLRALADDGTIDHVRGEGAMWAAGLHSTQNAMQIRDAMLSQGVICRALNADSLLFCPPLVITDGQVDRIVDALATLGGGPMTNATSDLLFNPFDPGFRANPYPTYARLRAEDPVHVSPLGFTVLTRYDDVARTLRGSEFARDIEAHTPAPVDPVRLARRERFQRRRADGKAAKTILNLDPPDHTRLRRLVSLAFTPSAIERLRPRMQQQVDEILDRAAERGSMELVDELAFPVPFQVISDLLDLPTERSDDIRDWSQALTAALEPTSDEDTLIAADTASIAMGEYLSEIIEHRRRHPGDDLLSALILAEESGDRLSAVELQSFTTLLYVAGHETTVNLIGNGMLALLQHPDELRRWRDDPTLDTSAVDELLRFDGPVQQTVRVPTQTVHYGDVTVEAGTTVMTVLGSASHDASVFDDPETLRLDRPNANRHLAFAAGVHYCLGASLAKLEAQVALTSVIRRFPQVELSGEPHWRDRLTIRGVDRLPLNLR